MTGRGAKDRVRLPAGSYVRVAATLTAAFFLGAFLAGAAGYIWYEQNLDEVLWQDARDNAATLAAALQEQGVTGLWREIGVYASRPESAEAPVFFETLSGLRTGNLVLQSAPFEGPHLIAADGSLLNRQPLFGRMGVLHGFGLRTPAGWIIAARASGSAAETRALLLRVAFWSLFSAALVTAAMAVWLAQRSAARLARVDAALEAAGHGDLSARVEISGGENDDAAWIARRVNQLLQQLETSVDEMQQVSVALAHDLRRPLQSVISHLEPYAADGATPDGFRDDLSAALSKLGDLNWTFDAILRLSRLESGVARVAHDPVDLSALARDTVELLEPVAEDRGQRLSAGEIAAVPMVPGDEPMLRQALINLVENALQHGPPGTAVRVSCTFDAGRVRLSVVDNGPGIPAERRAAVQQRFVRLDQTRSRPGTGLGLTLVAAIARRHGATLELDDADPGLRASLFFRVG